MDEHIVAETVLSDDEGMIDIEIRSQFFVVVLVFLFYILFRSIELNV